jgi:hypothetical protein
MTVHTAGILVSDLFLLFINKCPEQLKTHRHQNPCGPNTNCSNRRRPSPCCFSKLALYSPTGKIAPGFWTSKNPAGVLANKVSPNRYGISHPHICRPPHILHTFDAPCFSPAILLVSSGWTKLLNCLRSCSCWQSKYHALERHV